MSATTRPEVSGVLHALFTRSSLDVDQLVNLVPRLIAAGADINLANRAGRRPLADLVRTRLGDSDLEPLYEVVFVLDDLNLTGPATERGTSVLEYACIDAVSGSTRGARHALPTMSKQCQA